MKFGALLVLLLAGIAFADAQHGVGAADGLADDVTAAVRGVAPVGHVAVRVRARDAQAGKLAEVVEGLVIARVGLMHGVRSVTRWTGTPDEAGAAGFAWCLDGELVVENGQVTVLARLIPVGHDLWGEIAGRAPANAVASAPFAHAALGPELRAYLGLPTTLPAAVVATRVSHPRHFVFRALRTPLDLGAPLLALAAADLDGDGRAELLALTTDEVVVLDLGHDAARVRQRIPLDGPAPVPRPRDPVGTLVAADLDGDGHVEIIARSSAHVNGVALVWKDGALVKRLGARDFPICVTADEQGALHGVGAMLVPGRDLYDRAGLSATGMTLTPPERFQTAACATTPALVGFVDAGGVLSVFRASPQRAAWATLPAVGDAVVLADLDNDGLAEVVTTMARAPGGGDALTVQTLAADGTPRLLRRSPPLTGGVAAMTAGDFDGDGAAEVVAAVRAWGQTRSELWILE